MPHLKLHFYLRLYIITVEELRFCERLTQYI
nr:MAG TPA: hypothetical protein [Caudoviricetes sp.]